MRAAAAQLADVVRQLPWTRAAAPVVRSIVQSVRYRRQLRRGIAGEEFDALYGVRTRLVPPLSDLWRTMWRGGYDHEPSSSVRFREIFDALDIEFGQTVFIDYGSGAGRAVLLAAQYPFKAVIGIELAPWLHAQAQANLRAFPASAQRAARIELLCGDATAFVPPTDPLVLYFYTPFGVGPMQRVRARLEASLRERPRPVTIVLAYCFRQTRELLEKSPFLRVIGTDRGFTVLGDVAAAGVRRARSRSTA